MEEIINTIKALEGLVNAQIEQTKLINKRLEKLENPTIQETTTTLALPKTEQDLKNISKLPETVKELQHFDGDSTEYVSWVHNVANILSNYEIMRDKPYIKYKFKNKINKDRIRKLKKSQKMKITRENLNRSKPKTFELGDTILTAIKQIKSKNKPKFRKKTVAKDNNVTVTTISERRIHKTQMKELIQYSLNSSTYLLGQSMSMRIYEYNTPLVTLKQGNGKIISGSFKLIHVINLESYEDLINRITTTVNKTHQENKLHPQLQHQLNQITQLISELKGQKTRTKRSINWIGSAWKWIAGSPDATDWDQVVKSQNQIVNNNNQQYKINKALMETADKMLNEYNKIVDHFTDDSDEKLQQILFNRLLIVKEEIKEIVRAAQLAKAKIINTNLLDKMEINRLVTEVETLPYSNEIEAIEYAEPTMMIKDSTILYIISIPKTSEEDYNHIILRSTIDKSKQVHLEVNEVFLNQNKIFGIVQKCKIFRDTTICESNCLKELKDDHCINQLIKGADARCEFQFNKNQIIERLDGNTIFLSNFNGTISYNNTNKHLEGSFLVQYINETIKINNSIFTNKEEKTFQILPSILRTNITENGIKIDPEYLHSLYMENIEQLQEIFDENKEAAIIDSGIILIICGSIIMVFIKKLRAKRQTRILQNEILATSQSGIQFQPIKLNM